MRRRTTGHARKGYALIEVLAVTLIIAAFASIMIPTLERGREGARRLKCINNLHQVVSAIHLYEQDRKVFPPGVVNPTGPIDDSRYDQHIGMMTQFLPFLEQWSVSREVHSDVPVYAPENQTARNCHLSIFTCPDDARASMRGAIGLSSYAGCHHDVEAPIDLDNHGVFFLNSRVTYEDISDGTGFTIFLGEKVTPAIDFGWMSGTRATLRNTGTRINATDDGLSNGRPRRSPLYVGGFGSRHRGGANFAFGDGSVHFLSERIDLELYRRLGCRDDGELVGGDPY